MAAAALGFIAGFRLEDAPGAVVHQAKRCLLDLIGVAAAGSQLQSSRIIRSVAASQFGGIGRLVPVRRAQRQRDGGGPRQRHHDRRFRRA